MLSVEQTNAGKVRSPCILTEFEQAMVSKLTRFHEFSYLEIQTNIKECVILGASTVFIYYNNRHIGLFGTGETIYSGSGQTQMGTRDTNVSDNTYVTRSEPFYEFVRIWDSADSPDQLSQADLARADALARQLLNVTLGVLRFAVFGEKGNRYFALIEQLDLPAEMMLFFYNGYFDPDHARREDIPTHNDKQIAIKKLIGILEKAGSLRDYHFGEKTKQTIKEIDPDSYARLQALGILAKYHE